MRVNIWIDKDDIISGEITQHHYQCPQPGYQNYVQVSITPDEFTRLEDPKDIKHSNYIDDADEWLVEQYNRNRPISEQITKASQIPHDNEKWIFERNSDTEEVSKRKITKNLS